MFFCPNCNNSYDITKITSLQQQQQSGGKINNKKNTDITDSSIGYFDSTDSLMDTDSSLVGGDSLTDLIKGIVNNKIDNNKINEILKTIKPDDITKHLEFKKLDTKEKELVFNKIQDNLPQEKKKIIETAPTQKEESTALFICTNCGYTDKIQPKTLIFSKSTDTSSQDFSVSNYKNMLYSDILPRTRKYICKNPKCKSHTDPKEREAVMFRLNNKFNIKYICVSCKTEV